MKLAGLPTVLNEAWCVNQVADSTRSIVYWLVISMNLHFNKTNLPLNSHVVLRSSQSPRKLPQRMHPSPVRCIFRSKNTNIKAVYDPRGMGNATLSQKARSNLNRICKKRKRKTVQIGNQNFGPPPKTRSVTSRVRNILRHRVLVDKASIVLSISLMAKGKGCVSDVCYR